MNPSLAEYFESVLATGGADWRWQQAIEIARAPVSRTARDLDPLTRDAADYMRRSACDARSALLASKRYPLIDEARHLVGNPDNWRLLRLLVLTDVTKEEIATRMAISEQLVVTVEHLFFQVRAALQARDWICAMVIRPEQEAGRLELAAEMQFAVFGGPTAARTLLDAALRLPVDPLQRLHDAHLLMHTRFLAALGVPLDPNQAPKFVWQYAKFAQQQQRLDLQTKKLAAEIQRDLITGGASSARLDDEKCGAANCIDDIAATDHLESDRQQAAANSAAA
jgi:hypothetical protein